jgi:serine O-acetyltransferase
MSAQHPSELEDVITAVASSYAGGRLIDSLGTATLPNKRQVIEALNHLKAVMYLGYYATGSLDETKIRFAVGSHLYPAYEILVEQIRRAINYEGFRTAGEPRPPDWSRTTTLGLLESIPAIRALLSKDVLAAFQGDPAANSVEEIIFSYPSIEAITVHRRCCRGSWPSTRTRSPASTSIPARRSASRSSSTTARAWSSARRARSART